MPTTITAGEVMDRVAALMNDPAKTDYTYNAQLIYLNMAIDQLVEHMNELNSPISNATSASIKVPAGINRLSYTIEEAPIYPPDLVEIQGISERLYGSTDPLIPMVKREYIGFEPAQDALKYWAWEELRIKFNNNGAKTDRELILQYIRTNLLHAENENSIIHLSTSISFLAFKTASLCARYIGENEVRAGMLETDALLALERMDSIQNKGKQQIMTRHKPFRAGWKARGGY